MEEVVLSFGIIAVVVVHTDSRFTGAFESICKFLQIKFWPLARGNHKVNSVENYHQFLKKHKILQDKIVVVMIYLFKTQKHLRTCGTAPQSMIPIWCTVLQLLVDNSYFLWIRNCCRHQL